MDILLNEEAREVRTITVIVGNVRFEVPIYYTNVQALPFQPDSVHVSAWDSIKGSRVVIKRIHRVFMTAASAWSTYREISIQRFLGNHTNVLPLANIYTTPAGEANFNTVYLVFPYHEELSVYTSQPFFRWNLEMIKKIFFQSLLGIRHMHSCGIVHRDISPRSFFINETGRVMVGNFKTARGIYIESDPNRTYMEMFLTEYIGTSNFMAPETLLGVPYSEKADIWSFACTMLYVLCRVEWISGDTLDSAIDDIVKRYDLPGSVAINRHLPPGVVDRVERLRAMSKPGGSRSVFLLGNILPLEILAILDKMLKIEPHQRISLDVAIKDRYFDDIRGRFEIHSDFLTHAKYNNEFEELQMRYGRERSDLTILRDRIIHHVNEFALNRIILQGEDLARLPFQQHNEEDLVDEIAVLFPFLEQQNLPAPLRADAIRDLLVRPRNVQAVAEMDLMARNRREDAVQRGEIEVRLQMFRPLPPAEVPAVIPEHQVVPPDVAEEIRQDQNLRKKQRVAFIKGLITTTPGEPPENYSKVLTDGRLSLL